MSMQKWLRSFRKSRQQSSTRSRVGRPHSPRRCQVNALEDRTLLSTVHFINTAGDLDTANNWGTGAVPGAGDAVIIDLNGTAFTHSRAANRAVGEALRKRADLLDVRRD